MEKNKNHFPRLIPHFFFNENSSLILLLFLAVTFYSAMLKAQSLPVAGFTIDSTKVTIAQFTGDVQVHVTSTASNASQSVEYYFHDPGNFSTLGYGSATTFSTNPVLEFTHPAPNICMSVAMTQIATNSFGADTLTATFNVGCPCLSVPPQYWVNSTYSGNGNVSVSAGSNENSMSIDIGLGGCAPQIGFCNTVLPGPGTYPFCVYFYGGTCDGYICDTITAPCGAAPSANFSSADTFGTVSFTNLVQNWPVGNTVWYFGDGDSSTMVNPSHTYLSQGNYWVCQTISNECGNATYCDSVYAGCAAPNAGFTASFNFLNAIFTNFSTGTGNLSYAWDFGDGNVSSLANPSHTYNFPGTYTVCLFATDDCGTNSICLNSTVTCAAPQAGFFSISNQLTFNFNNTSTGTGNLGYMWDFGDGNTGTGANPSHTYTAPGSYTVCMNAVDTCGSASVCDTVVASCSAPAASFSSTSNNLQVSFNGIGAGIGPFSYSWDFGNGGSSTLQNPVYLFPATGTYLVCLTVMDACGQTTFCDSVSVSCPAPLASFTIQQGMGLVILNGFASGQGPFSYNWDYGDNNSGTGQNPSHTYTANGSYLVCLTLSDVCGSMMTCDTVVVTGLTGQDDPLISAFSVYPNPVDGQLVLDFAEVPLTEVRIGLYDLQGMEVWAKVCQGNESEIVLDLSELGEGVYFLKTWVRGRQVFQKILVARP
jgi:PKD repeat protein